MILLEYGICSIQSTDKLFNTLHVCRGAWPDCKGSVRQETISKTITTCNHSNRYHNNSIENNAEEHKKLTLRGPICGKRKALVTVCCASLVLLSKNKKTCFCYFQKITYVHSQTTTLLTKTTNALVNSPKLS